MRRLRLGAPVLLCLLFPAANAQVNSTPSACTCQDIPDIQDRLQKLQAIKQMALNILGVASPNTPASKQQWAQLQNGIRQYLQYMQTQNPSASTGTTLFNNTADPFCGSQANAPTACLSESYAVHQSAHAQSCQAGNWSWQNPWTSVVMLQEEIAALQAEIDFLQSVHCGVANNSNAPTGLATSTQVPTGMCPQFQLNVQVITTSAVSIPGALNEQSGRSLNNGQGISVPLTVHDDGSFEGFGSGSDAGTAYGAAPGEVVSGQFGHMQSIAASGLIQPGSCNPQPCQPDVMHLVLVGGPSQQMTQTQARGAVNRNLQQITPTGAAQMQFDLPAYVGGSAQRTLLAMGILNSNMTVFLLQADNGSPVLPDGSSLLYAQQQCKVASGVGIGAGGGGAAGVVIPGVNVGNIPGVQSVGNLPVVIQINEKIHAADLPTSQGPAVVMINEAIHLADTMSPVTGANINVTESVPVGEAPSAH